MTNRNQMALDEMPNPETTSFEGIGIWAESHYDTLRQALTAQQVKDGEVQEAIKYLQSVKLGTYEKRKAVNTLIRAATAPKCDALVKALNSAKGTLHYIEVQAKAGHNGFNAVAAGNASMAQEKIEAALEAHRATERGQGE